MNNNSFIKFVFVSFFIWLFCASYAQERSFLTTYSEEDRSWIVNDAVETPNGDFLICANDNWGGGCLLLRLSADGEVHTKTIVVAEDTTLYAHGLLQMVEGKGCEYVFLCFGQPNDGGMAALLFMRIDEELNITFRKTILCTFLDNGSRFYDAKFLLSETSIIYGALTYKFSNMPNSVFLIKFDLDGNQLNCQRLDFVSSVCNLFQSEESRFGLFCKFDLSYMGIMTFDTSLQVTDNDTIFQWSVPEGGNGDFCHYTIMDMINSQAAMLPDGSYMVSAKLSESLYNANGYPYKYDRSVILAKYEYDFHQPENLIVTEHMNDSVEYPAFYRSMDFKETAEAKYEVFQCSILNELPQFGLFQPQSTGVVVTKTDQNLNIEWKKRFLRNGNYQAMVINATSDGGCLVAGSVGDYQTQRFDAFALKINANGIVGLDEIKEESIAYVYPNPAEETIRIIGVEAKETQVYNALGQCVKTFQGNEYNVEGLSYGIYLLRIRDGENKLYSLRIVVK